MNTKYEKLISRIAKNDNMKKQHWKDLQIAYSVADMMFGDETVFFERLAKIGFKVPEDRQERFFKEYKTEMSHVSEIIKDFEIEWDLEDDPEPKCGNGLNAPFGFIRMKCRYGDDNKCIHCGIGIPF